MARVNEVTLGDLAKKHGVEIKDIVEKSGVKEHTLRKWVNARPELMRIIMTHCASGQQKDKLTKLLLETLNTAESLK